MEWKSSTYKNKYGNVIGEVKHHTLFEDGSITNYDVQFGNRIIKNLVSLVKVELYHIGVLILMN